MQQNLTAVLAEAERLRRRDMQRFARTASSAAQAEPLADPALAPGKRVFDTVTGKEGTIVNRAQTNYFVSAAKE
jgi:hypothetical protein